MKNLIAIAALLLISFGAKAQITKASLQASGLTCSMCSKAIYKALQKVPSIQNIDVDVERSEYRITFKPGAVVVLDDVKHAVERAGFSVAAMDVTAILPKTDIAPDAHVNLGGATYHFVKVHAQTIEGERTFRILDKSYISQKEHAEYGKHTSMKCYHTGIMESCCSRESAKRVYHVTLKS